MFVKDLDSLLHHLLEVVCRRKRIVSLHVVDVLRGEQKHLARLDSDGREVTLGRAFEAI